MGVLSQETLAQHQEYVERLEGAKDLDALKVIDKEHYNAWFSALILATPRGMAGTLVQTRKDEINARRQEFEHISGLRQAELLPQWIESAMNEIGEVNPKTKKAIEEMLPILEELYDKVNELLDYQASLFDKSRQLKSYRKGVPFSQFRLPWATVKGLDRSNGIERNSVMLKAIVSKFATEKHPTSPLKIDDMCYRTTTNG